MGFFTKEGILWLLILGACYASRQMDSFNENGVLVVSFVTVLYTIWYLHFCYTETMKNPEKVNDLYYRLNGGK